MFLILEAQFHRQGPTGCYQTFSRSFHRQTKRRQKNDIFGEVWRSVKKSQRKSNHITWSTVHSTNVSFASRLSENSYGAVPRISIGVKISNFHEFLQIYSLNLWLLQSKFVAKNSLNLCIFYREAQLLKVYYK